MTRTELEVVHAELYHYQHGRYTTVTAVMVVINTAVTDIDGRVGSNDVTEMLVE